MSDAGDDLLKALAELMYQGQDGPGNAAEPTDAPAEPPSEDFRARLIACERAANA